MDENTSAFIRQLCITFVHGDDGKALIESINAQTHWPAFISAANAHRLLPLAYWTFKRVGVELPADVHRVIAGAYLRQKFVANKQIEALLQALAAFKREGIEAVVLKGGVLATKLYPEPALRPMDDIDILIAPDRLMKAREVLISLGYEAPLPSSRFDRLKHHLPIAVRQDAGVTIGIELHRDAFHWHLNEPLNFSHLARPFAQHRINDATIDYLGEANLLWMQYRGLRRFQEPLKKLHLIDIALMTERLPDHWQGAALRTTRPDLWNALVVLDTYIPFSDRIRQYLGFPARQTIHDQAQGTKDLRGWALMSTKSPLSDWRQMIWPSRPWATFFYGLDINIHRWHIQAQHLRVCLKQLTQRVQSMVRLPTPYLMSKAPPTSVNSHRTVLVTCMYNGLSGTRFGGRAHRVEFYQESLATIARASQLPIVCFVAPEELEAHQRFFEHRPHQITWVTLALTDFPHSNEIQRIKSEQPDQYGAFEWQQRCVEIMWGKFHLLGEAIKRYPQAEHVYWIDAGLANVSVISSKYTSAEALEQKDFHRVDSAFTPSLFANMQAFGADRVVALTCTCPHSLPIPAKYNQHPYANGNGLIGGLFGGRKKSVQEFCAFFEEKCQKILQDHALYFEESIMSGVYADHPDLFKLFTFDSWYHEGWEYHNPQLVNFSSFFDLMLGTPPIDNPPKIP